jgi:hypothetical protein
LELFNIFAFCRIGWAKSNFSLSKTIQLELTFRFLPDRDDNGRWLVCLASHDVYGAEARSASVRLDVYYPPKVAVSVLHELSDSREGGRVALSCNQHFAEPFLNHFRFSQKGSVDARPANDMKIHWSWSGTDSKRLLVSGKDPQRMEIRHLRVEDNGARIFCQVRFLRFSFHKKTTQNRRRTNSGWPMPPFNWTSPTAHASSAGPSWRSRTSATRSPSNGTVYYFNKHIC